MWEGLTTAAPPPQVAQLTERRLGARPEFDSGSNLVNFVRDPGIVKVASSNQSLAMLAFETHKFGLALMSHLRQFRPVDQLS